MWNQEWQMRKRCAFTRLLRVEVEKQPIKPYFPQRPVSSFCYYCLFGLFSTTPHVLESMLICGSIILRCLHGRRMINIFGYVQIFMDARAINKRATTRKSLIYGCVIY